MSVQLDFFKNAINKKRMSHLYLLSGASGTGKLDLAYNVSYLLLKDYDSKDNLLDNIKADNHSQVYHISPDGNVIKKEQIISLQSEFTKTSLINAPRIYIIEDIDLISTSAANSLLKFMEEPENALVYGILITSNVSKVLPTITSRSQVVRIYDTNNNHIYDYLTNLDVDSYKAKMISFLTKNEEEALLYIDDLSLSQVITYIYSFILDYAKSSFSPSISITKELSNTLFDRKYYQIFLELLLINLLDLLKYILKEEYQLNELEELYNENYKNFDSNKISKAINLIQEEISKLSTYINIGLSLEVLMINIK